MRFTFGYTAGDFGWHGVLDLFAQARGIVLARISASPSPRLVGRALGSNSPLWPALTIAPNGHYWQTSTLDGVRRVFAYHKLAGYPLITVAGLAVVDIVEQSSSVRRVILATAAVATLVILILLVVWMRQQLVHEQLTRLREDALRANQAKSAFLANMSHEIRTPLNGVIGLSHLALGTMLDDEQRDYLKKIDYSAKSLLNIINDILDISKVESGKLELEDIPFTLAAVLENVRSLVSIRATEKGLAFQLHVEPNVPSDLIGDPLRFGQIMLNLTSNAIKFTERGSVTVNIAVRHESERTVELATSIRDTGIGMSVPDQSRVFEAFMQSDSSITRRFGGTGLGLAISKALAEKMGGAITIESALGVGSTFTFTAIFGRADEASKSTGKAVDAMTAVEMRAKLAGHRVLVAEDNAINQQIIDRLLKRLGMLVEFAGNGQEAVDIVFAEPKRFRAVIMDLQMPVMDGLQATRLIRQRVGSAELPIIAMTAHAMEEERRMCLAAGMNDHLPKPVDPRALARALDRWINANTTSVGT